MKAFFAYIKEHIPAIFFPAVAACFLIFVYLYAWHNNAVNNTKYDLASYVEFMKWTIANIVGLFATHSGLNTDIPWIGKLLEKVGK